MKQLFGEMMKTIRIWITRALIRMALKTCIHGFSYDHLKEALELESNE